jgi:hypothetical protein
MAWTEYKIYGKSQESWDNVKTIEFQTHQNRITFLSVLIGKNYPCWARGVAG